MVDFARFVPNRPAPETDLRALNDILTQPRREAEDKRRFDEQNARSNAFLKLQQDAQSRKFSKEDQAEVEGLMAELQLAQDQGDPVVHARALEKLRRYGFDVSKPDLASFTGQGAVKPAPLSTQRPNLQAFTGEKPGPNPIEDAIQTELASREALRAGNAQPEQDLSQEDFEAQLINETGSAPERYEVGGKTTEEFKARLPQAPEDETVDLGDVDSPEFQAAARAEAAPLVTQGLPSGMKAPEAPGRTSAARPLSTQMGGNIISKNGRVVASDSGPSGRWQSTIAGAFEPFTTQENPKFADAAKRAQALATQLVAMDGISPKDAVQFAFQRYENEVQGINNLERTIIGSRPKYGGGSGGGAGGDYVVGANGRADAALNDDLDKVRTMWVNSAGYKKMEEQAGLLDDAEAGLMSDDGIAQNNAVATLRRIQSGLTLNAQEMRDFQSAAGAIEALKKQYNRFFGTGQLPEEYKRQTRAVLNNMRQIVNRRMQRGADEAYEYFMKTRGRSAKPEIVQEKSEALRESLRGGVTTPPDPNADLDQ